MKKKAKPVTRTQKTQGIRNQALTNINTAITLQNGIEKYLHDLQIQNYSDLTVYGYQKRLQLFQRWCIDRALTHASSITENHLDRYRRYLHQYTYGNKRINAATQKGHLMVIKQLFKWLHKARWITYNPALNLELPKTPYRLTHRLLTQAEIKSLINVIDLESATGLRDRSIIETLYSTGLRRAELINLNIDDIDISDGMLLVRQGKGNKDRKIPTGQRALHWIDRYLNEWRTQRPRATHTNLLYLSEKGYPMRETEIGQKIRDYKTAAGITKPGGCHLFRHAMATHMLDNGADIRHIQDMLGHSNLNSTQIYTQVSKQALKDVHKKTHPMSQGIDD